MIIHAGKRLNGNALEGITGDYTVHLSPSGSQDRVGFERWCHEFVRVVRVGKSDERKTWLCLDGHNSRWTHDGLSFLKDNNAIAICLPSRAPIITQPNDNGINRCFHQHAGDLAAEWRELCAGRRIQKGDANRIICAAWKRCQIWNQDVMMTRGFGSSTTGACPKDSMPPPPPSLPPPPFFIVHV
jgi:hypothetical protein